jgi:Acetyltransferase (GNAT) domain
MYIGLANRTYSDEIVSFLSSNIDSSHSGLYNQEFLCPDGVKASIRRNQMLIALEKNEVVGAVRFYPKKTTNTISLYQFAVRKDYRGIGLLENMLKTLNIAPIQVMCPVESGFNEFYKKKGWVLSDVGEKLNVWNFDR